MAAVNKEYAVNWKDHTSHMKEAFESLFDNNEYVDVTLYCDGQRIEAHKMVLSACSPYFRSIFKDVPCQHHVIVLNNVDFSVVEHLVHFIYHGEVNVHNSKLNLFLQTARMLRIMGLTDIGSPTETAKDAVELSETDVDKRTLDGNLSAEVPQAFKLPRLDAAPAELEDYELIDVKCEPGEPELYDPHEDALQQGSSSHDYPREALVLLKEEERESENVDDTSMVEEVSNEIDVVAPTTEDADSVLPSKSKHLYEESYSAYSKWRIKRNIGTTENSILTYFDTELSHYKRSSLYTKFYMLRSTINLREGIDIGRFSGIIPFLKRKRDESRLNRRSTQNTGRTLNQRPVLNQVRALKQERTLKLKQKSTPWMSRILTKKQIYDFLVQASDEDHLLNKVILIIGIAGGCKSRDLVSLLTTSVEDCGTHFRIKLNNGTKGSKKCRSFVVLPGDNEYLNVCDIIRAYIALRPDVTTHDRFFVNYSREKCSSRFVGQSRIGDVPNLVAHFLDLENPSSYNGNCFRYTAMAFLADGRHAF